MKIFTDYKSQETINEFINIVNQDKPLFISRIGGSDYDVVVKYFNDKTIINNNYSFYLERLKIFNGYFDFNNEKNNFVNYLEKMIEFYLDNDGLTYGGSHLISQFSNNKFNIYDKNFIEYISKDKNLISYTFIESVRPFLQSFEYWGKNKKILIISPLSKSIEYQFKNKDNLYLDYKFPNFDLVTYNTKITYNNNKDSKETLNVHTNNWHEECLRMSEEISKIDFDIALLSCASYSMFLGNFIKNNLHKKSIYLGGVLNVFFNIYGGRFDNYYKNSGLNIDYQIDAFENEDIKNIKWW